MWVCMFRCGIWSQMVVVADGEGRAAPKCVDIRPYQARMIRDSDIRPDMA